MGTISKAMTLLAGALAASTLAPAHAEPTVGRYVALGDSYAAVADMTALYGTPGCFRSTKNYANVVAAGLRPTTFVDNTCGDAVTANMTAPQSVGLAVNPPQFDGLTPDTDLVTVTIGGNDLNLPTTLAPCGAMALVEPQGNPCERFYTSDGVDRIAERLHSEIRPRISAVLQGIRDRAPQARIVVVGYLPQFPESTGCFPQTPIAAGDIPYLRRSFGGLSTLLMDEARAIGAIGVDPSGITGHDMCQPEGTRWTEPLIPGSPTSPLHPNTTGTRALGDMILAALR